MTTAILIYMLTPTLVHLEPYVLGWSYSKITDPVIIRLFYRKNSEEIPPELSKVPAKN